MGLTGALVGIPVGLTGAFLTGFEVGGAALPLTGGTNLFTTIISLSYKLQIVADQQPEDCAPRPHSHGPGD